MLAAWPYLLPWKDPAWMVVGNLLFWPAYFVGVVILDRWERSRRRRRHRQRGATA